MGRGESTGRKAVEIAYLSVLTEEDVNHRTKKAFSSEIQRKGEWVHLNTFQESKYDLVRHCSRLHFTIWRISLK